MEPVARDPATGSGAWILRPVVGQPRTATGIVESSVWRLFAWIGIVAATIYLVFVGGTWPGIYTTEFRIISIGIAVAATAVWFLAVRRSRWR